MFIKYLNNIYNLNNFYSIIKGLDYNNLKSPIHLMKDDSNFTALDFDSRDVRDHILNRIWEEIEKKSNCYDVDKDLKLYKESKKYNL